ncbi:SGNH/GDSL hydrolase family protein [Aquisphaera insulae]|uniref:SGNH/GDSL hydrolase family protein n=1 Tax=Aquisphaera insulae TaxID=2712864 RepID=UPI0013E9B68A|nr:SGNH/GDSL hydrolase family protein [Aquisphaera insulae]
MSRRLNQRTFRFIERPQRLARRFKAGILAATALLVVLTIGGSSHGRNAIAWLASRGRWAAIRAVGGKPSRAEIDADWARRRRHDVEQARIRLRKTYDQYDPAMRRLLDYAGLDPDHALLRWGNFDRVVYLPSTVFEPDEDGRSYRLRPLTRSVWIRNLKLKDGLLAYFPLPDGPQLDELVQAAGAVLVKTSRQTTSSWGLRGPEPELAADLRGIVLGDSYMQGLFVGDDETPVECLKRELSATLKRRAEILNTGHLGYSPEQEFFTLRSLAERFPPRFVVLSLFANDFGELFEVLDGRGDWEESRYWIEQILDYCRTRGIVCLVVPAPWVNQLRGPRRTGHYPGRLPDLIDVDSLAYLDPIEAFAAETLRLSTGPKASAGAVTANPLFNGGLGDGHFSGAGCRLWAKSVAERLILLLNREDSPPRASASLGSSGHSPMIFTSTRLGRRPSNSP